MKTRYLLQDEIIYQETLKCGLNVLIHPKKDYLQKVASLNINFGGEDVEFLLNGEKTTLPQGTAHFLEHMLFENNGRHLTEVFSSNGAEINAYTTRSMTSYSFSCQSEFKYLLGYLLDTFIKVDFLNESITKEKRIIERELKMSDDDIEYEAEYKLKQMLYTDIRPTVKIGGKSSEIKKIDRQTLKRAFKTFYHPKNMFLVLTGDFRPEEVAKYLRNHPYNLHDWPEFHKIKRTFSPDKRTRHNFTKYDKNHLVNYVQIGVKIPKEIFRKVNNYGKLNLIASSFSYYFFGKTSNIYSVLKQRNLINYSFSFTANIDTDYVYLTITTETKRPNVYIEQMQELLQDIPNQNFNEKTFLAIKRKAIGNYINLFDSITAINDFVVSRVARGNNEFDYISDLQNLQTADLEMLKPIFVPENIFTLSYLKPRK